MKISQRLVVSFSLLIGLLFAIAFVSHARLKELATVTRVIVEVQVLRTNLAQEANLHAQKAANCLMKLLQTADREKRIPIYGEMDAELAAADAAVEQVGTTLQSPGERAELDRLDTLREDYDTRFRETVEMIEIEGVDAARMHFAAHTEKSLAALLKGASELAATQRRQMEAHLAELTRAEAGAQKMVVALSLLAVVAGVLLAWIMTRSIVRPVAEAVKVAEAIAAGDLACKVPPGRRDEMGQLLRSLATMRDSIVSREDKIRRLAYEDGLTGLPNRTRLIEFFDRQGAQAHGALLLLDIDRFALINNALGHAVGDALLKEIGRRLATLAVPPSLPARLWGDQFAFLLIDADRAAAQAFAEAALALLRTPLHVDSQRLDVAATFGIACYPDDGSDAPLLLRRAELAMRDAKRRRSPVAFAAAAGQEPPHEHLSLIGDMREALAHGDFVLHYQPKFHLRQGRATGAEALLRWQHPDKGLIPPGRFIPFAEQTGFIRDITPWLLEQVVRHAAAWRREGMDIVPSANLSAYDLLNPELVAHVRALLHKHGLAPEQICLEITESALMEEPALALRHLNELAALGVKLSIDDYGTGQASLAYLKTLPVHELKIDRAFVANVAQDSRNGAIVRSTIVLSHELGLSVVAEGAETAEEIDWLRRQGGDFVQGYGIARPMPLEAFKAWVTAAAS
jgi:diguanylate cyclase (GGDEF)-like protein